MIAGQADGMAENPTGTPWGCDAPPGTTVATIDASGEHHDGMFPCVTMASIADELDAKAISWRYYAPSLVQGGGDYGANWSAFSAINNIYQGGHGPDWVNNVISPETQILSDLASGNQARVTWVVPSLNNSDHPGDGIDNGPQWVASIVNAVESGANWKDTAIFVVWDDWGGWYDHVAPKIIDYQSLGFRVPLIAISPYAKKGTFRTCNTRRRASCASSRTNSGWVSSASRTRARADSTICSTSPKRRGDRRSFASRRARCAR